MALSRGSRLLYDWLKEQNAGTIVSYENLMEVTGWSRTSLLTYIGKNKFAPFLTKVDGYKLKVVLNGSEVTEQYFDETFTQTAPRQIALAPGDRLEGQNGAYTLEEPIGEGAIGKVWMVRTQQQQRHAAKIMLPRTDLLLSSKMPDIRERFRREANYGKTIDHPNVVDYLDVGQTERNPFLIMELANRSVADSLKADGAIIEEDVAEISLMALESSDPAMGMSTHGGERRVCHGAPATRRVQPARKSCRAVPLISPLPQTTRVPASAHVRHRRRRTVPRVRGQTPGLPPQGVALHCGKSVWSRRRGTRGGGRRGCPGAPATAAQAHGARPAPVERDLGERPGRRRGRRQRLPCHPLLAQSQAVISRRAALLHSFSLVPLARNDVNNRHRIPCINRRNHHNNTRSYKL